jgi:hypothetical protein
MDLLLVPVLLEMTQLQERMKMKSNFAIAMDLSLQLLCYL